MAPLLNGWRLAERNLLIFAPVRAANGDCEAIVKARAIAKERDCELPVDFRAALSGNLAPTGRPRAFSEGAVKKGALH